MKILILPALSAALLSLAGCAHSPGTEDASRAAASARHPSSSMAYFDSTVAVEYFEPSDFFWPGMYRYYDKTHKVVCYQLRSSSVLSCAPSAAKDEAR